jgi:hypothetical protein
VPRLLEEPAPSAGWRSPHLLLAGPRTDDRAVADGSVFADGAECRQLSDAADIELTADTESRQLEPPPSDTTPNQQAEPHRRSAIAHRKRERESLVHMGRVILADHNLVKWRAKFSFHIFFTKEELY